MQTATNAPAAFAGAPELTLGQLALITLGRLVLNIGTRLIYPLLPFLAPRLGVDLPTAGLLVTVLVAASLASPLGGIFTDLRGERAGMSIGLALLCAGALLCALSASFAGFLAGYTLIGLAAPLYQPAAQSYLSARSHYGRRGRVLGVLELSWAASALLGIAPLMLLVQRTGSVAVAFWVVLGLALVMLALLRTLPPTPRRVVAAGERRIAWGTLFLPRVLGLLGLAALAMCGIDLMLVALSAWLNADFGADAARIGQLFALMGVAELLGSLGATLLVDRIGKRRAVLGGFVLTAVSMALLPLSAGSWVLLVPLLFLFDLAYEFSIVATFPLASGVAPAVRGTVLALLGAAVGSGRGIGSLLSEPLRSGFGFGANGLIAAVLTLLGVLLCFAFVRETENEAGK
ncbi:MAG TPA: MFS transporter [Roseiflexaceae bacterium]|nr:MFS transporter [Roseiflexaceae bacterium]